MPPLPAGPLEAPEVSDGVTVFGTDVDGSSLGPQPPTNAPRMNTAKSNRYLSFMSAFSAFPCRRQGSYETLPWRSGMLMIGRCIRPQE